MSGGATGKKNLKGGVGAAAEILNYMGNALETEMMESVRSFDPDLAQKIEDKMTAEERAHLKISWILMIAASSSFSGKFSRSR